MDSYQFRYLVTLLHLIPVVSSTCTLLLAIIQYSSLQILTRSEIRDLNERIISCYFTAFFDSIVLRVVGNLLTTMVSVACIFRLSDMSLGEQKSCHWYLAGACLAMAHLLVYPIIAPHVEALRKDCRDKNIDALQDWLRIHWLRSVVIDLPAWVCCVVGAINSLVK
ncbi:hypothetical protein F4821DRAFT_249408 [Hypoxylon rubiginosum]|uniref:Uncharacterized protein n=1 Tax=Hypoxylon rubiginosum TaxID=110542 RepID=A0ACC0CLY7_9PEZI|nr:hypothetical protein F4821DRAFT_249408 [Hypoxylon rubiginosum]